MKIWINPRQIQMDNYNKVASLFPNIEFTSDKNNSFDADVVMGYPEYFNEEILAQYSNLKWIHLLTAGYETLDLNMTKNRNIVVTNSRGVFSATMAEDVICKMLMMNRNVKLYLENMKNHIWYTPRNELEIQGATIGLIGAGSIATEVAKRLKAFDAKVIGYKRTEEPTPYFDQMYTGKDGLIEVLKQSDYVVITASLNPSTYHLINKDNIGYMKESAMLINVSRGDIIDQAALIEALISKKIRAAALDVTSPEPLPEESPLWDLENVFITPHNSVASPMLYDRMTNLIIDNLTRYINHSELINILTK